jgi:hypothetical protein
MDNIANIGVSGVFQRFHSHRDSIVKERVMPTNSTMRFLNWEVKRKMKSERKYVQASSQNGKARRDGGLGFKSEEVME